MNNKILLILILVSVFSCDKLSKFKKEYYENGKVRLKYEHSENQKEGKCIEYYENGNLASITYWKKDTL